MSNIKNCLASERGFTLVEIIASLVLLSLVVVSVVPLFIQLQDWSSENGDLLASAYALEAVAAEVTSDARLSEMVNLATMNTIVDADDTDALRHADFDIDMYTAYDADRDLFTGDIRIYNADGDEINRGHVYIGRGDAE